MEKLKEKHSSYPRNKHIVEVFFRAGYIESWGRGIEKMVTACRDAGFWSRMYLGRMKKRGEFDNVVDLRFNTVVPFDHFLIDSILRIGIFKYTIVRHMLYIN